MSEHGACGFFRAFRRRLFLAMEAAEGGTEVFLPTADPDAGEWRMDYDRAARILVYLRARERRTSK